MMAHSGVGLSLSFGDGPITSLNSSKAAASDSEAGSIDVGFQTPDDIQIGGWDVGTSGAGSSSQVAASKRKARRCWSPELHRRFVSALQELGGAESTYLSHFSLTVFHLGKYFLLQSHA
jgi:hypothetical protein